jgi:hypothetical protein
MIALMRKTAHSKSEHLSLTGIKKGIYSHGGCKPRIWPILGRRSELSGSSREGWVERSLDSAATSRMCKYLVTRKWKTFKL